jgi:hypothetical protein
MGSESVGAVPRDDYGRLGFVLGSGRTATWAAVRGGGCTGATGGLGIGVELVISVRGVLGIGGLVLWVYIRRRSLEVQLWPQEVVEVARATLVFFIVPRHRHIYSLPPLICNPLFLRRSFSLSLSLSLSDLRLQAKAKENPRKGVKCLISHARLQNRKIIAHSCVYRLRREKVFKEF